MRPSFENLFSATAAGISISLPRVRARHHMRQRDPRNEERPFDSLFDQVGVGRTARTKRLRQMVTRG